MNPSPAPPWAGAARALPSLVEELPVGLLQFSKELGVECVNSVARQILDGHDGGILKDALGRLGDDFQDAGSPVELLVNSAGGGIRLVAIPGEQGGSHVAILQRNVEERHRRLSMAMRRLIALPCGTLGVAAATSQALGIATTAVRAASISLFERDGQAGLRLVCSAGRLAGTAQGLPQEQDILKAAELGRPLAAPAPAAGKAAPGLHPGHPGALALPVTAGGKMLGVIWAVGATDDFLEHELRLLYVLADVLALLLGAAARLAQLEHLRRRGDAQEAGGDLPPQDSVFPPTAALPEAAHWPLVSEQERHRLMGALARLRSAQSSSQTVTLRWPDGTQEECNVAMTLEKNRGDPAVFRAVLQQVPASPDSSLEPRPMRPLMERMATLGRLTAGLVHEVSNVLSFLMGNLDVMQESIRDLQATAGELALARTQLDDLMDAVTDAREGASRIWSMVKDVRLISRGDAAPSTHAILADSAALSARMLVPELRARATLEMDLPPLPPIQMEPHKLAQVLLNLIINATHAMPERPHMQNIIRLAARAEGASAILDVMDNGSGIPADVLPRIFDPFFSTKHPGGGTGLGLAICREIVEQAGGTVEVESVVGQGTSFRLVLPFASSLEASEPRVAPALAPGRQLRILVVDDDALLARALARTLHGHQVQVCSGGAAALELLRTGEEFDAIFSDVTMPGMTGPEFLQALQVQHPSAAQRLMFMTGGILNDAAAEFLAAVPNAILEKPLSLAAVTAAILDLQQRAATHSLEEA